MPFPCTFDTSVPKQGKVYSSLWCSGSSSTKTWQDFSLTLAAVGMHKVPQLHLLCADLGFKSKCFMLGLSNGKDEMSDCQVWRAAWSGRAILQHSDLLSMACSRIMCFGRHLSCRLSQCLQKHCYTLANPASRTVNVLKALLGCRAASAAQSVR